MSDETKPSDENAQPQPKFALGQEVLYGEGKVKVVAYDPAAGYTVIAPAKVTVQEDALAALPEHQA